ncbi:MAG TPA: hypothetical protein VIM29_07925, partial [Bacillota bacterium]
MKVLGKRKENAETGVKKTNFFSKLLFHEDVYYQLGGFLLLGLVVFFISWAIFAFVVKKPDLMANSFMVQKLFKIEAAPAMGEWGVKTFGKTWKLFGKSYDVAKTVNVW